MKSIFRIAFVLLLLTPVTAHAQLFKGGFMGGFNGSQVDGDNFSGYDRLGLMAGAFIYTPLSRSIDLQFEIEYMGKGAAYHTPTTDDPNANIEIYRSNFHYIELPILLRFKTRSAIAFEGGLGFGYLFSYSVDDDVNGSLSTDPDPGSLFKKYELSGIVGGSYTFADKYTVDLRYSYSITSIANFAVATYNPFLLGRSGVFNNLFTLGLYYTLGNK